ncbi:MAG: rod shape-determining protein MreD [Spirochaetia bacterium]|nr:rod shape-determining protein MreD [Spirochaetia bacterium]
MIRRFLLTLGLLVGALVLQSTWLDAIAIRSVVPDLALLIIVFVSFSTRDLLGQASGFAAGFLQDGMSAGPLGLNALVKTAMAWTFNALSGKFYIDRVVMPLAFGFGATVIKAVYLAILAWMFSGKIQSYDFGDAKLWIEAGYNAVSAPVVFLILSPLKSFLAGRNAQS